MKVEMKILLKFLFIWSNFGLFLCFPSNNHASFYMLQKQPIGNQLNLYNSSTIDWNQQNPLNSKWNLWQEPQQAENNLYEMHYIVQPAGYSPHRLPPSEKSQRVPSQPKHQPISNSLMLTLLGWWSVSNKFLAVSYESWLISSRSQNLYFLVQSCKLF